MNGQLFEQQRRSIVTQTDRFGFLVDENRLLKIAQLYAAQFNAAYFIKK
jgi:hypothetical protein